MKWRRPKVAGYPMGAAVETWPAGTAGLERHLAGTIADVRTTGDGVAVAVLVAVDQDHREWVAVEDVMRVWLGEVEVAV